MYIVNDQTFIDNLLMFLLDVLYEFKVSFSFICSSDDTDAVLTVSVYINNVAAEDCTIDVKL